MAKKEKVETVKISAQLVTVGIILLLGILFPRVAIAATTPFRSAHIITTDGATPYTNLSNCSLTDGATCDRASATSFANLYFRSFGTYADFGMPTGSVIHNIRVRVTGNVSTPIYVGLSGGNIFAANCQFPSDLWKLTLLNLPTIASQTFVTPLLNQQVANSVYALCLSQSNVDSDKVIFRINYASPQAWSAHIDNLEIAFDYDPPVVSPTPTTTPTPIPGPTPFLDLPWDYEGKGMSFTEAALAINSYFDHSYPLLSSGLIEPDDSLKDIVNYNGKHTQDFYSSHDGYDYGRSADVQLGDPVLAAASGSAQYINSCGACGNMVVIDHGNGYQTRYLHLQKDGLITSIPGQSVQVAVHQPIGKVGATGNVSPPGDAGAHIHIGVFEDKNHDGNFEDNIPDGVTDPFGWQSRDPDPWEQYSFFYTGLQRSGNKSYYLWKKHLDNLDTTLATEGGTFTNGRVSVQFDQGTTDQDLSLHMTSEPQVTIDSTRQSIGSTIGITLQTAAGDAVTLLTKPMLLTYDFSNTDTSLFKLGTFSIYSSTDSANWVQEQSFTDYLHGKTTASVNHLTHFALIGELADTIAPHTTATIDGMQGQPNWYRSDATVTLNAEDNAGGLGVDYTMVRYDGGDWDTYTQPINFTTEGQHTIDYYSVDKAGNIESIQKAVFTIDKTSPEAIIRYDFGSEDINVVGTDTASDTTISQVNTGNNSQDMTISDSAGNTLVLHGIEREHGPNSMITTDTLGYNDRTHVLDPNKLSVHYSTDSIGIKAFKQTYTVKGILKIELMYDSGTDMTTVITDKQKIVLNGMRILQLTTHDGTLQYNY